MPSPTYTFTSGQTILASEINANFNKLTECLALAGGTLTGTVLASPTNTINLGSAALAFASVFTYALKLLDTYASHVLSVVAGSNLTANRTLTLTTGDANRTLTISADSTLNGTAYNVGGTDVALADGGTGASLADPNADRIMFWDDSGGAVTWLSLGTNLSITGTTLNAAQTIISGTDNRLVRCDGTTGIQSSGITVDDTDTVTGVAAITATTVNGTTGNITTVNSTTGNITTVSATTVSASGTVSGATVTSSGNINATSGTVTGNNVTANSALSFYSMGVINQTGKSNDTVYQASTDGFLLCRIDGTSGVGYGNIVTDAANPPTSVMGLASVNNNYATMMVPVKKNHYYKLITNTSSGSVSYVTIWVPFGTVG